jgi:aminoglycoside phosphotransferase (APT) family kinase protein
MGIDSASGIRTSSATIVSFMRVGAAKSGSAASDGLSAWLEHVTDDPGPFAITQLSGGNSNDTLLVSSPTAKRLLRRPPGATIDSSAHSVEREYRILMAIVDTHVLVPRPIATAREPTPGDAPALLMEYIDGVSLASELPDSYPPGAVAAVGHEVIDALADLHSLPWVELGLDGFGRPAHFLERQVGRWRKQYERYKHRELPDFDVVAKWLERHRPPDVEPGIMHGDFHVDNCLFSKNPPARLLAIIDWEMSSIGDPLLDVGLLLGFWGTDRRKPVAMPRVQGFSRTRDAPSREQLAERYAVRSGRSVDELAYYMTLAFWKLAAIVEGAHLHYTTGRVKTDYAEALGEDVPRLLAEARTFAGID